jgi:DNA-binding CsgD family transcriptional regulator
MLRQDLQRTTFELVRSLDPTFEATAAVEQFDRHIRSLGFTYAMCLKVPEIDQDLSDCLLLCSFPEEWIARYAGQDYVKHDPIVRELFRTYQPYTWSEVRARRSLTGIGQRILDEAAAIGATEGFVVPIYEASGYTGLVSIAGPGVEIAAEARNALALACIYLHNKLSTLKRQSTDTSVGLTERELECLCWAAAGKSDWEIGQILSVSSKTINYHIENAKRKFGVTTRIQAIIAAMRSGKLAR